MGDSKTTSLSRNNTTKVALVPQQVTRRHVRIAHVSSVHPWSDNRIHFRECQSLAQAGYEVTLVAVETDMVGIRPAVSVRAYKGRNSRLTRMVFGSWAAIGMALRSHPHIVHLHDPELSWAIPLLRIAGKHVIYDAHEDLPSQLLDKSYINPRLRRITSYVGRLIVGLTRSASHVITATEKIAERYPQGKVTVVHNYPPALPRVKSVTPLVERENRVVYLGGITEGRGFSQMIDATKEESWPFEWKLILAGPISDQLRTRLEDTQTNPRVEYLGRLPPDDARALLDTAKVGLCLFQDTSAHRDALPTKVFEYLEAGLPVIASDFPLWKQLFETCGILVDQSSPSEVARAVAAYDAHPDLLVHHSAQALAVSAESTWDSEAAKLLGVYADLTRRSTSDSSA